jgi:hypothetical protein
VINLGGSGVLLAWLVSGGLDLPKQGYWFLWSIDILVPVIALGEILFWFRQRGKKQ